MNFKKIFSAVLALVLIFGISFKTEAALVQVYDGGVRNFFKVFEIISKNKNVYFDEPDFYTHKGVKRCDVNFGDSSDSFVRFILNNDGSVSRILIRIPSDASVSTGLDAGYICGACLGTIGLNSQEYFSIWGRLSDDVSSTLKNNPYASNFKKNYSAWCSKTNRYVAVEFEFDLSGGWYDIYAYK